MNQPNPIKGEQAVETSIAEYRPVADAIAGLRSKYVGVVYDVQSPAGLAECRKARAEVRKHRTTLESVRQQIKAPALDLCRRIDADAKTITAALVAIEDPLDEQIKAEEEAADARREAKRKAEMERLARLNQMVADIRGWPLAAVGTSAQELREHIQTRESISLEAFPEEIRRECGEAKEEALRKLRQMLAERKAQETEDARLAADRAAEHERQVAEDKRLRAERQRLEAERIEAERLAAEERARHAEERDRWFREEAEQRTRIQAEAQEAEERLAAQRAVMERELAEERARLDAERAREEPSVPWEASGPSERTLRAGPSEPPAQPAPQEAAEPGTTVMRVPFEKLGGHYHCRVFTARALGSSFMKNGDLVFDEREWPDIPLLMRGAEFLEEAGFFRGKESGWP